MRDRPSVPKFIVRAQRIWRRWVQAAYWITVALWRVETGRIFVFRDSPDWVVGLLATARRPADLDDEDILRLLALANEERELRRANRRRARLTEEKP